MKECIYPGCGRPVGSKADDCHPWSCGKTICDAYAKGVQAERARIVKSLRDEVAKDKSDPKNQIVEMVMAIAKGTVLGFADRIEMGLS
jgi:hypothetical protein